MKKIIQLIIVILITSHDLICEEPEKASLDQVKLVAKATALSLKELLKLKKFSNQSMRSVIGYISGNNQGILLIKQTAPEYPENSYYERLVGSDRKAMLYKKDLNYQLNQNYVHHVFDRTLLFRFGYGIAIDSMIKNIAPSTASYLEKVALSVIIQATIGTFLFDRHLRTALIQGSVEEKSTERLLYSFKTLATYLAASHVNTLISTMTPHAHKAVSRVKKSAQRLFSTTQRGYAYLISKTKNTFRKKNA